jgi:hypothetical protein
MKVRGDPDLGSPNHVCPGGATDPKRFYGEGSEGGPGEEGENCEERGNVLIIQENKVAENDGQWDDASSGGYFYFEFKEAARFESLGIMDIDANEKRNKVELQFVDNGTQDYWYKALGGDTYRTVDCKADKVKRVKVELPGNSGAISDLRFCNKVCR